MALVPKLVDDLGASKQGVRIVHGVIFLELQKFVGARLGESAWEGLVKGTGLGPQAYLAVKEYPDDDAARLVEAASTAAGVPRSALLEDFGEFAVPGLLRFYGSQLDPAWKTLDVIENTEESIHRVVRRRNPGARPPQLHCARLGPREVVVHYKSARRMCGFAKGLCKGLAAHFGETVSIEETSCMLAGATECRIRVQLSG